MRRGKSSGTIWFLLYLILGIYFFNVAFGFINLPGFVFKIDKWIIFIGGVFLIIGGVNYLRARRHKIYS